MGEEGKTSVAAMMMIDDGAKAKSAESPRRKKEWNYKEATSIKIVAIVSSTQPSSTLIIQRARGVLCMGPQFHSYRTLFSAPFLLPTSDLFFLSPHFNGFVRNEGTKANESDKKVERINTTK